MIELEIEQAIIDLISPICDVTANVPSPKQLDNLPLVVINMTDGVCSQSMMGNSNLIDVDGSFVVDVLTFVKQDTFDYSKQIVEAINNAKIKFKLQLTGFKNSIDTTGQKPIYVRELTYSAKFRENYATV